MKLNQLVKSCYYKVTWKVLQASYVNLFYHNAGMPFLKSFHLPNVSGSDTPSLNTGVKTFFNRPLPCAIEPGAK